MPDFRFPNESDEYRAARDQLLELEKDLRARSEAVAQVRRGLPLGGRLKEDYRFEHIGDDDSVQSVAFENLFGNYDSLLLYSMMFGPEWDAPCPSCTSLVDGYNANYHPVSQHCAMAVVAAAGPRQLHDWARTRGWKIPLYSAGGNDYILAYFANPEATDPAMAAMMNVFKKTPDGIFHTWGTELVNHPLESGHPRHVDVVWLFWNLLDMTPEGRPDVSVPAQDFEHAYFSEYVLGEGD